jgi:hypothetical protein
MSTKVPLPKTTNALLSVLRTDLRLRTALIDGGLKVRSQGNRNKRRFSWRGRQFVIFETVFRFVVTDARGRWLVVRYH